MNTKVRLLVLSVSAWSSKVGLNTWPVFLEGHDPNAVANICIREEMPDSDVCNNYFVISESKVIKSVLNRRIKTGSRVEPRESDMERQYHLAAHNRRYFAMKKRGRPVIALLAREMLWKLGKWKTKELEEFVKNFNPDVILYSMDGYIHFNRICAYVKKISSAKSIGFFADDNFTYKQSKRFRDNFFRFFQRQSLKRLVHKCDAFFAITNTTKKEADNFFKIDCQVLSKPLNRIPIVQNKELSAPLRILYTGNLLVGRERSLIKIINSLKHINIDKTHFVVDVYTPTQLLEKEKKQIECDFCSIHSPISQSEVFHLQSEADVLLFLEDIDGVNAKTARLSFSTKITDYLSSGKCIFAVGCMDTAPMQYFLENDSAIIATDEEQMVKKFNEILNDNSIINLYAQKAYECGIRNHKKEDVLRIFNDTIESLI